MAAPDTYNKRRLVFLLAFLGLLFALLLGRLFYVQVLWGPVLQEMALTQWTMDSSLSAERGRIMDRDGQTLAQSGTVYMVEINPNEINALELVRVATELSNVLEMDYAYVLSRISDKEKQQIILKRQIEREKVDELITCKLGNGVTFGVDTKRYYPMGNMLSQTLGFTTVDGVGQEGLERTYDKYLAGEAGRLITETDRKNKPLAYGTQEYIEPVDGCSLVLTVDTIVQAYLEKALQEALTVNEAKTAQGLVLDVQTGEILAVSTKPDFDVNAPPRDRMEELRALVKNRVVCDAYEPGSTFKIITLSSALDSGAVTLESVYDCPGYKVVNNERIKCWKTSHGHQTLEEAVRNSCNPAFMSMALHMGTDTFYDYIYRYGFGASTESGLPGESGGIVIHQKYIRENNIARIGFGQSIAVTPMQLAAAVAAAINGGELMQPYIVKQVLDEEGNVIRQSSPTVIRRVIKAETSAQVRALLESVVENGSGRNAQIPGYRVGGKTGTAQKYVDGKVSTGSLIASFIGFAPADDPRYLVLMLVDEPQVGVIFGSTVAAPFVKDVLHETLLHYGVAPSLPVETVTVPNIVGVAAIKAAEELEKLGLVGDFPEGEGDDEVKTQLPAAGSTANKGGGVLLYTTKTARGSEDLYQEAVIEVPDLTGLTPLQAYDRLHTLGLELRFNHEEQSGKAVRQKPAAGEQLAIGQQVTVDFSSVE
ncbi:MAG: PASTA domain-containing protein [Clostridiales bacterium]|jgi:stage V sporulation protein D (sporulation-specific penicillin-binding protein)|nr:PASTA domain-containing protein [Clostridiales bacterium]